MRPSAAPVSAARGHVLAHLTAPEAAARLAAGTCVLWPMGSLETHGPHAPMGDHLLAEAIARRMAEAAGALGADALVAPALPFGGDDVFAGVPGAVALSPATLEAVVAETLDALLAGGARRVVVVNGHGGSVPAIEAAQRRVLRARGALVPALHLWRIAAAALPALGADPRAAGHGGDPVWSAALHLLPDACRPDLARPAVTPPPVLGLPVAGFGAVTLEGAEVALPLGIEAIAPGGAAAADPARGSAELGARIVAHLAGIGGRLVRHLADLDAAAAAGPDPVPGDGAGGGAGG